ncbi:MAG: LLM class flavin-dependent oxidoreductase [Thermomicrobiales bacterium]|nr:LLM class flavin-dependent oxidoreductase [Thermomicrobiales bacterium]MCO5220525.1 LLM class flavin-dependent oxidoreductase [Thermomicrobiales bacterium]
MTIELGLFDIHQVDPTDPDPTDRVFERRLHLLALADEVGLSYAFTAERHFLQTYRAPAPTAWIAAASQRTSKIRLGVLAYTLPMHLPAALAEEVAVLDHLTRGRLEVGFGLGHRPEELEGIGIDPSEREQLFQERYAVMTALWEGATVGLDRPGTVIRNIAIHPPPLQQPYPPLWFAGSDPHGAYWAGTRGMSLAIGFKRTVDLMPSVTAFRAARDAKPSNLAGAGRIALMRQVAIAASDQAAIDAMAEDLDRLHRMGTGSQSDAEQARAFAHRLIAEETFVAGSPDTVANAILKAQEQLGISVFLANIHASGVSDDRLGEMTRLLATEVAPRLRAAGDGGLA